MSVKARTKQDGKTVFDVRIQYGGMRVARTVPTTATEAKRVESKILHDLIHGKYEILRNRKNPSFNQYAQEYQKSVTWQKSYRRTTQLIAHLKNYFGSKKLTEITIQDFIDYRAMRLKQVSVATINREYSCLLRMLNLAIKNDELLINKNTLNGIRKFKEPPVENRVLSIDEYRKLMDAAPEYFKRIMFFACNTGMRLMEILNLKYG